MNLPNYEKAARPLLLALIMLGACTENNAPNNVAKNTSEVFEIKDLPDPQSWKEDEIWRYFFDHRGHKETFITFDDQTLTGRVRDQCGLVIVAAPKGSSPSRNISFYKNQMYKLPKKVECWATSAPKMMERRAEELEYLKGLLPLVERLPVPNGETAYDWSKNSDLNKVRNATLSDEVASFEMEMQRFATAPDYFQNFIGGENRLRRSNRESWKRAASIAAEDFARDNPFNRPSPGQAPLSTGLTLSQDIIYTNNPAVKLALANLDNTMFGEHALAQELSRRAALSGAQQQISNAAGANNSESGLALTLTQECRYGQNSDGSCVTWEQHEAKFDAEEREKEAKYARQRSAGLVAIERRAQLARVQAAERRDKYARSCGYASWAEYAERAKASCR